MAGTAKEALGNISKVRNKPSRYGAEVSTLPAYNTLNFSKIVPVIVSGVADNATDEWFDLTGDASNPRFVNYKLNGTYYYTITTPPAVNKPAVIDINLATGSVVTVKDPLGNVLWSGTA